MTGKKAKVAFVGNFEYYCGSSNALLGYVRAGKSLEYNIRASEFGYVDNIIRAKVPVANRDWRPDLLVIVYETYPFLSKEDVEQICISIPRNRRVLIDPDGKYSPPSFADDDTNHPTEDSYQFWTSLYDSLSDTILQPILGDKDKVSGKVHSFLYFGMDSTIPDSSKQPKDLDLVYVGNNWFRWSDIKWLIKKIAPIRTRLKKVGLVGKYWSDEVMKGYEEATYSDPEFLKKNNVDIYKSAPYGQVEKTMSRGLINPILVRPILNHLGFITPRMLETFMADTIPIIPNYFTHAPSLYGNEVEKLTLSGDPASDILRVLDDYNKHKEISLNIRKKIKSQHSYETRLEQLLTYA